MHTLPDLADCSSGVKELQWPRCK